MKKIGILTFHRALNYGAVLQAYALTQKINSINKGNIEIIDYRCKEIEKYRKLGQVEKKATPKNIIRMAMLYNKRRKFDKFMRTRMNISTKTYYSTNAKSIGEDYDLIVVGSDQVWNHKITKNDYTYLLDFETSKKKKCSYAASMGLSELNDEEKSTYKKLLEGFYHISVRENECFNILSGDIKLNVDGVHLDPTLLLDEADWRKIANGKINSKKYILVYNVPKPDNLFNIAKLVAKQTGYELIYIPIGVRPKNGKIVFPSVEQFLCLFSNAEYIITNSFHGTVFAIQFKKKMLVELKKNGTGNDRIKTLLSACGLTNRILDEEHPEKIFEEINWNEVEEKLSEYKKKSIDYIAEIVK